MKEKMRRKLISHSFFLLYDPDLELVKKNVALFVGFDNVSGSIHMNNLETHKTQTGWPPPPLSLAHVPTGKNTSGAFLLSRWPARRGCPIIIYLISPFSFSVWKEIKKDLQMKIMHKDAFSVIQGETFWAALWKPGTSDVAYWVFRQVPWKCHGVLWNALDYH